MDKTKMIMFKNLDAFIRKNRFYFKEKLIGSRCGYDFHFWLTFMPSGKAHIGIREFVRNRESLIFDTLKEEKVTERKYHGT